MGDLPQKRLQEAGGGASCGAEPLSAHSEMGPILEEAAAQVGLSICTYDVHTHRITFARNRAAQNLRERWSIPAVLEHVPSLESTWIAEEDFPAYCDLYRAIDSGAPTASCTYRLKTEADAAPCYRTIAYTTVFDDRNEPVYAFGVGKDVTETRLRSKNTRAPYKICSIRTPPAWAPRALT